LEIRRALDIALSDTQTQSGIQTRTKYLSIH